METVRFDSTALPALRDTPQGFKRATARLTRIGVLKYELPDGSVRRELRLPEEVFSLNSLETLRGAPVTVKHPGMVSPTNVRAVRVGGQHGEIKQDGDFVSTELQIEDAGAIARVEKKELQEISCGYHCRLEKKSGTWRGQKYDAIQRDIQYNHIAIGPKGWGRAGSDVTLRLDGGVSRAESADCESGLSARDEMIVRRRSMAVQPSRIARSDSSDPRPQRDLNAAAAAARRIMETSGGQRTKLNPDARREMIERRHQRCAPVRAKDGDHK